MKNQKAIVTIAMEERYYSNWKKFCEPTWKQYADKYGFDLICLQHPLDHSERACAVSGLAKVPDPKSGFCTEL